MSKRIGDNHRMPTIHARLLSGFLGGLALAVIPFGLVGSAEASDSLIEPGVLESVETKDGWTTEKYSDGLTVRFGGPRGDRFEHSEQDGRDGEYGMPDGYGKLPPSGWVDEFIDDIINLSYMGGPNNSRLQSCLRDYADYFLKIGEPAKAEPLAEQYVHIQKVLHAPSPLAFGQLLLGKTKLALNKQDEAMAPLKAAAAFYSTDSDQRSYCESLDKLGIALTKSGHAFEALEPLSTCLRLATEKSYSDISQDASNHLVDVKAKLHDTSN